MKQVLLILLVVFSTTVAAEKWSAIGLLTTKLEGQPAKVEALELDDFDSYESCIAVVKAESMSDNYIAKNNGTNSRLPSVHWNYDADCVLKRND